MPQQANGYLLLKHNNNERHEVVDTLITKGEQGKARARITVPQLGESQLIIATENGECYIPLTVTVGRKVKVTIDWQQPWLYTATGYAEVNLRNKLIRKLGKLKTHNEMLEIAAQFIDKHATEKGVTELSQEFFPSWQGAVDFIKYTKRDTISRALTYLHQNYNLYRTRLNNNYSLQNIPCLLTDTLQSLANYRSIPYEKVFVVELAKHPSKNAGEQKYDKRFVADSLCQALFVISYFQQSNITSKTSLFPAKTDSITTANKLKRLENEIKSVTQERDSLKRGNYKKEDVAFAELEKKLLDLHETKKDLQQTAKRLKDLTADWEKHPRRIILPSTTAGWVQFCEENVVEQTPYYFVFNRNKHILYRGGSQDSALIVADSLLKSINNNLTE